MKKPILNSKKAIKIIRKDKRSGNVLNFRIEGGRKLSGEITVRTSKNSALGIMCASLLNKNTTIIKNAPKIEEVFRIAEILESMGVKIKWRKNDLVIIPPQKL